VNELADALSAVRGQIAALAAQVQDVIAATEMANSDDEHDPEGSTIAFDRAQLLALLDQARAQERELVDAQDRVERGAYGRCETCGGAIPPARLAARPSARTCVSCAVGIGS
jgi:DnaK suppressor protein